MEIRPLGAELFHAVGQTDMTKLTVTFRNFVDALKNGYIFSYCTLFLFLPSPLSFLSSASLSPPIFISSHYRLLTVKYDLPITR